MYEEDEYLQVSGLQHFAFCRRQWALIYIEGLWKDNFYTIDGDIFHERAHDSSLRSRSSDKIVVRGLSISSSRLGVSGQCDVVEFHRSDDGVRLPYLLKNDDLWLPFPVEYKRGSDTHSEADSLQLCCQAMCLEDMLCCTIREGALYYGVNRRRFPVTFDERLRSLVIKHLAEMHDLYKRQRTPVVKASKKCRACSLRDECMPGLGKVSSVDGYYREHLGV